MMADRAEWKRRWVIAGLVTGAALLVRLFFLFGSGDRGWPHSAWYEGDAITWVEWAGALAAGEPFEFNLPLRTPATAYLLAWTGATNPPFVWAKLAWCLLSALTCGTAFLAFRMITSERAALLGAALCTFSFGSYLTATSLNNETPYTLALVLSVWTTQKLARRPSLGWSVPAGILHGAAMLIRAEHILLLAMLALFPTATVARRERPRALQYGGIVVLTAVATCLPWSIQGHLAAGAFNRGTPRTLDFRMSPVPWTEDARALIESLPAFAREGNFRFISSLAEQERRERVDRSFAEAFFTERFDYVPEPISEWTLVSSKGALDFALANHPEATGGFSRAGLDDWAGRDANFSFGRPSHLKLYNHGYREGLRSIADDPVGSLRRTGRKLTIFLEGATLGVTAYNLPYGRESVRRPVDLATPSTTAAWWWRVPILGLIVVGVVLAVRRRIAGAWMLVILYKLAVTVAFYGYARQAVSISPAFHLFMALAIMGAIDALVDRRARWVAGVRALGVALAVAALAVELLAAWRAESMVARPGGPDAVIRPNPDWGDGAFESHDRVELHPPRRGAAPG